MSKTARHTKSAFTIIEVVLVLAIAGLIFLMVFIALPALQREQRNTQRRRDVDRIFAAVLEYQKNNHNKTPAKLDYYTVTSIDKNFIPRYIDSSCHTKDDSGTQYEDCSDQFTDPDGTTYNIIVDGDYNSAYQVPSNTNRLASSAKNILTASPIMLAKADISSQREVWLNHSIYMIFGYTCSAVEGQMFYTGNKNDYLIAMHLEGGSSYCHGTITSQPEDADGHTGLPIDRIMRVD